MSHLIDGRSLSAFIKEAHKTLKAPAQQRSRPLTLVVGNESADLDSICSALVLAYLRTHTPPHKFHVPLAAIPRADIPLRPELAVALRHTGISPSDIPTLTDLPPSFPEDPPLDLILVDHNAPTGPFSLSQPKPPKLIGCIDHHKDEGVMPRDAGPRIIETSGSCMSLVLKHCLDGQVKDAPRQDRIADAAVRKLALAPILVDTGCLRVESRTTEADVVAVEVAERLIRGVGGEEEGKEAWRGEYDREAYYEELQRVKGDVSGLELRGVLRKDYKQWKEGEGKKAMALGVSSVPQGFGQLLERPGEGKEVLVEALRAWATEQELDIVAVMTTLQKEAGGTGGDGGGFGRELLVWAVTSRGVGAAQLFADLSGDRLGLRTWRDGELDFRAENGAECRTCWDQEKTDCSRKQVGPWLREAMAASMERC